MDSPYYNGLGTILQSSPHLPGDFAEISCLGNFAIEHHKQWGGTLNTE